MKPLGKYSEIQLEHFEDKKTYFHINFGLFKVSAVPSVQCCTVQYTVYNLQCTVYNLQCTVYSIQCAVCSVQGTEYIVQGKGYNVQCTV